MFILLIPIGSSGMSPFIAQFDGTFGVTSWNGSPTCAYFINNGNNQDSAELTQPPDGSALSKYLGMLLYPSGICILMPSFRG